jgi:type I restriction enzyme S subunit
MRESIKGWTTVHLNGLLTTNFSGSWGDEPSSVRRANVQVIRSNDFTEDGRIDFSTAVARHHTQRELARLSLRQGDLVVEASGMGSGRAVLVQNLPANGSFACSNFHRVLRPNTTVVDPRYLILWLQRLDSHSGVLKYRQQTVIINLNIVAYLNQPVLRPPLHEQYRITEIIDATDVAIARGDRLAAKQLALHRGLSERLVQDARIPWKSTLGDHIQGIQAGRSPDLEDTPAGPGQWGVLKVSAINSDGFLSDENKVVTEPGLIKPALEIQPSDLLLSRANTMALVGLCCIAENPRPNLMLSDKILRIVPKRSEMDAVFLYMVLSSHRARYQIQALATGTSGSMKNIAQEAIRSLVVPCPPLDEQRRIVSTFQGGAATIEYEAAELAKLRLMKQGLVEDLLTGRVRVPG